MTRFTLLILASAAAIPVAGCASAGLPLYPTAENVNARPFFVASKGTFRKPDVLDVAPVGKPLEAAPALAVAEATAPAPATHGPVKLIPGPVTVAPLPAPSSASSAASSAAGVTPAAPVAPPSAVNATPAAPVVPPAAPVAAPAPPVAPAPPPAVSVAPAASEAPAAPATPSAPTVTASVVPGSAPIVAAPASSSAPVAAPVVPAVVAPPEPPAPPPPPPLPEWTMARGETLVGKITAWALKAGWNAPMRAKADDWLIEVTPPPLTATFEDAVQYLADGFQRATPRPRIILSPSARSILIESVN